MTNVDRPNLLFIMSDDHAAHAISAYGSVLAATPNIDRIGASGARLENVICTNSICTPSRASILTGQYSHINGVRTLEDPLDPERETYAKALQRAGYQTAIIGKWHLGHGAEHAPAGFDHWEVLPGQGRYVDPEFITEDGIAVREGYVTDVITDLSLEWLRERDPDKPFALMCHHKAVHAPWEPDEKHRDMFTGPLPIPSTLWDTYEGRPAARAAEYMRLEGMPPSYVKELPPAELSEEDAVLWYSSRSTPESSDQREERYHAFVRDYLRCAASVDDNVGKMLDFLDAAGLAENTVVIYTSDQGFFLGDHGWFDKRFMYEESIRMPFLIRWPGVVEPGTVIADLVSNVDFAPTFIDMAGLPAPADMQGTSMAPLLRGEAEASRDAIYYRYWMHPTPHGVPPHYGVRTRDYKLIRYDLSALSLGESETEWELYDLVSDPQEVRNVYGVEEYEKIQEDLHAELSRLRAQFRDTEDYPQCATTRSENLVDDTSAEARRADRFGLRGQLARDRAHAAHTG